MMDLTKIEPIKTTQQVAPAQNTPTPVPGSSVHAKEPIQPANIPSSPEAQNFRKDHWTPDKFMEDGQVQAGEVDQEQVEFLKTTEFVK